MFKHILVVCTGNICRSPMAEALLRAASAHGGGHHRIVESAGVGAVVGSHPTAEAIDVMRVHGHDIHKHVARQLTGKMLTGADLVLTMDGSHSSWIHQRFPQFRGKVHKLLKWRGNQDVDDPIGQPREFFDKTYEEITVGVADWMKRL